jgi:hypothetical protein
MWTVNFFAGAPSQLWDVAIEQFYGDGNEITNDLAVPPSQGNVCYGVWVRVANNTYKMKHIGWAYGPNNVYIGRFDLAATIEVRNHGNSFVGRFRADQEDRIGGFGVMQSLGLHLSCLLREGVGQRLFGPGWSSSQLASGTDAFS